MIYLLFNTITHKGQCKKLIDRQHTTPQFYLRYFCPCWVFQLGKNKPRWITTPIDEEVHSKYYGEFDKINTEIENISAPVYSKLIENPLSIEPEGEKFILSVLFANLFLRNPNNIERWRKVRTLLTEQFIEKLGIMSHSNSDASNLLLQLNKEYNNLKTKGGHHFAVDNNFSALLDITECINKMSFFVFEAPKGLYFLTSDNPLLLEGYWEIENTFAQIALCPTHILFMKYCGSPFIQLGKATAKQVEKLNLDIIRNAKQNIYSNKRNHQACKWMRKECEYA